MIAISIVLACSRGIYVPGLIILIDSTLTTPRLLRRSLFAWKNTPFLFNKM